ncbi:Oxygen-insensitive NADPH nitroreductase [Paramagnetospirillum magnetotacticum MS-1]|uniref:Oxygen-insensitive NADPH nitroreductase n=1 Tax=Paramagnetospirillum magnetotacticum MS-1 TaxID=272627 RepID=A0A0C2Z0V9_PARME|nr:nitroreductase [Paramagnetospirillum magnetotacticum]KIM00536.1 Oxygen-insensitive NADPH nitroreductase [Paramagnetospirillum magnetotacticum MS-1]
MEPSPSTPLTIFDALTSRASMRAFLPTPVPRLTVEAILALAARAPSGSNIQPWTVHVLEGEARDRLCQRLLQAHREDEPGHGDDYTYYPPEWFEPFLSRRRKLGLDLYRSLGIGRDDRQRMKDQLGRNYLFFDAPIGMILTLDRRHGQSAWIDLGAFLQSLMLAARGYGLHTCPQQAFARFHRLIRPILGIPETEVVVCGLALGHADTSAPENALVSERVPVAEFARFHSG